MKQDFYKLAKQVGEILEAKKLMLVTAESCTGGQVAQTVTSVSGSACWFERGFVTYSNEAKQEMLGVKPATIETYGAVSEETAREMAEGALLHSHAQISLAITGIAGPTGGSKEKPVGTVCFAWTGQNLPTTSITKHFIGHRDDIRTQATQFVLETLIKTVIPAQAGI
jgi:nicotinamide-nucleotide amidase